ncbi:hypothetical protein [Pseudoramibacter faecis]|uniref:hypothetical protein n=1 Tax=Pseudoramibacter faecis TaxID=3108534 RepID=UPI002E7616DA|nr:hypothetical protein [Pseudoramibacter sp. HA2172]
MSVNQVDEEIAQIRKMAVLFSFVFILIHLVDLCDDEPIDQQADRSDRDVKISGLLRGRFTCITGCTVISRPHSEA